MDFNKVNEANKAGENTPAASNINTDKQVIPPVEDGVDKQPANTVGLEMKVLMNLILKNELLLLI